jgi:hypothetical protein
MRIGYVGTAIGSMRARASSFANFSMSTGQERRLPSRVENAMWRAEFASRVPWDAVALATLVSGLEALLKTDQGGSTDQCKTRVPALAFDLGCDAITTGLCRRM